MIEIKRNDMIQGSLMITAREASKALKISERHLRRLVAEKRIPFYRLSERTLRFDLSELRDHMRLIAEGRTTPDDEGAGDA